MVSLFHSHPPCLNPVSSIVWLACLWVQLQVMPWNIWRICHGTIPLMWPGSEVTDVTVSQNQKLRGNLAKESYFMFFSLPVSPGNSWRKNILVLEILDMFYLQIVAVGFQVDAPRNEHGRHGTLTIDRDTSGYPDASGYLYELTTPGAKPPAELTNWIIGWFWCREGEGEVITWEKLGGWNIISIIHMNWTGLRSARIRFILKIT